MADLKISALPSATLPLAGTETIPLVQGGVTSKALASDLFQWPGGRVSYVPVGGNIQAYVTAATAGDTLILGAGTYTVTATITVDKAILIKGQGLSATKVVTSTANLAVFTFGAGASSAKITDLYVGNTGTGTSFAFFAGDGLSQLQISNVIAVLGGNGLKYGIWSQSSITISNCEMYITSADLNSNGVMIYNDNAATLNISANIQNVRVLSTGATLNNRGIVFNNNDTSVGSFTIAGNVTNCNLNAYASTGVTDIALYVNSTTTNNVTVNAYNSVFDGADSDVTVIGTNSCTLSNCTLTHGTATGTVVYAGTQVVSNITASGNSILGDAEATDTHTIKGATTLLANSANAALKITQTGAGNAFVVEDSASTDSTPFVVTATGAVGIGTSSPNNYNGGLVAFGQVIETVADDSSGGVQGYRASENTGSSNWYFGKSRGTTAAKTVVQSGDGLGILNWRGYDGATNIIGALIKAEVDGTPGTNDMPGRLVLSTTADGASSPTEQLRINSAGVITARSGTAIPAGGTAGFGYCATSTANFGVFFGSGVPTLSAAKGSLYLRSDGSGVADRMYVNTDGGTTWTAVATVA